MPLTQNDIPWLEKVAGYIVTALCSSVVGAFIVGSQYRTVKSDIASLKKENEDREEKEKEQKAFCIDRWDSIINLQKESSEKMAQTLCQSFERMIVKLQQENTENLNNLKIDLAVLNTNVQMLLESHKSTDELKTLLQSIVDRRESDKEPYIMERRKH